MGLDDNVADMLTKPLICPKQVKFVQMILQHIYPVKGLDNVKKERSKSFLLSIRTGTSASHQCVSDVGVGAVGFCNSNFVFFF